MNPYTRLRNVLADLYASVDASVVIMAEIGMTKGFVLPELPPRSRWHFIIVQARRANLIPALIQAAREDYPDNAELSALADGNGAVSVPVRGLMRIFLVSPKSDLEFAPSEVQDVLNSGLDVVHSLLDDVTYTQFTREVRRVPYARNGSPPYVLWLAMHGGTQGWQLKDGMLDGFALAALVRGRFGYVYLNTCQSWQMAQILQNDGGSDVVCTISDVPDLDAYRTGSLMAAALVETGDFRAAYERSKPGNNVDYIYLSAPKKNEWRTMAT